MKEVKELKGESSVSIRKGKKLMSYDYAYKLDFECNLKDGEGKTVGSITGTYDIPEMSNATGDDDDWEANVYWGDDTDKIRDRVNDVVRNKTVDALKKELRVKFVDELKQK